MVVVVGYCYYHRLLDNQCWPYTKAEADGFRLETGSGHLRYPGQPGHVLPGSNGSDPDSASDHVH